MQKIQLKGTRVILLMISLGLGMPCFSQSGNSANYTIHGTIEKADTQLPIRLNKYNPIDQSTETVAQSAVNDKGEYSLTFDFSEPELYRLDFPGRQDVMMTIDEGQNDIRVNAEGIRDGYVEIVGSKDSEKLLGYEIFRTKSKNELITPANFAIREARKSGDTEAEIEAVDNYVKASELHRTELMNYIEKHIGSSLALYGTVLRWTGDDEVNRLEKLVNAFAIERPGLNATRVMQEKVERFKNVAIGAKAPALVAATPGGETLALKDVEAEYVLIDFWASWCGPCISQIPDLIKAYDDFNDKGFEILGVSVDDKADKWQEAIARFELNWLHISDLQGWQSELAKDYNVTYIPFNLIVDKNGMIVAKNMHSKSLQSKLSELFVDKY